jgi:hypothetical protein
MAGLLQEDNFGHSPLSEIYLIGCNLRDVSGIYSTPSSDDCQYG